MCLCSDGRWSDKLYHCRLADNVPAMRDDEPRSALLRIYGSTSRNSGNKMADSVSLALLSERGIGPKLFGVFEDGRLEEYDSASWL